MRGIQKEPNQLLADQKQLIPKITLKEDIRERFAALGAIYFKAI